MDNDEAVLLRRELRTANREGKPIFVCAICSTKLELRCSNRSFQNTGKYFFFFKHYKDCSECPIKTDSQLSRDELLARKYKNTKESLPHIELKNKLGAIIEQFHSPKELSIDSKFYLDKSGNGERRKPDVYAVINEREYAFEIQLNTTFLSVIEEREAFYERNEVTILWIFKDFPLEDKDQRLTQKDIYVPNRFNAFVLDDEMLELSMREEKLQLRVYYKTFYIDDWEISSKWNTEIISINELKYGEDFKPFYYDSFACKKRAKEELRLKNEELEAEQQRKRRALKLEQELLAKKNRIKEDKILRCRHLVDNISLIIYSLESHKIQQLTKMSEIESEIDRLKTANQEFLQLLGSIPEVVEKNNHYFTSSSRQSLRYLSDHISSHCDLSSLIEKHHENIKRLDKCVKEIQQELNEDVFPKKNYINTFPICEIGDISYSIIKADKINDQLVNKFPHEVKIIDSKELGTFFAESYIKELPNKEFFTYHSRVNNYAVTFLIDFTSRMENLMYRELELNSRLEEIDQEKLSTINEMRNDLICLLEEEQNQNTNQIIQNQECINNIQNDLIQNSINLQKLTNRRDRAYDLMYRIK